MKSISISICLILIAFSCGSSESEEVSSLREKVMELESKLANELTRNSPWKTDYQDAWIEICEKVFTFEEENNSSFSASKVCRCSLDDMMLIFDLEEYEAWPQHIKDGAAAPHVHRCWPT